MRQRILKGGIMHALGLASLAMLLVPNAAHAGHWSFTGTLTVNGSPWGGSQSSNGSWSAGAPAYGQYGPSGPINSTFVYTVAGAWVPDNSGDTSQPPASILVTASDTASAAAITPGQSPPSASVDDGQGDSPVNSTSYPPHVTVATSTSSGKHLVSATNGSFSITVTMTATASGPSGASGSSGLTIAPDTRSATITTNLGTTWHKGPLDPVTHLPTIVKDAPDSSGTLTATIVGPDGVFLSGNNPSITFSGFANAGFSPGSRFNMYSAALGNDQSGSFNAAGLVTSFTNVYSDTSTASEHVNLHLTDAIDGAIASANSYVNFHNAVETWAKTSGPTPGPTTNPTGSGTNIVANGWNLFTTISNVTGSLPLTEQITETATGESKVSGTIGSTTGFTLSLAQQSAAFTENESTTIDQSYTASTSVVTTISVPAGKTLVLFWAPTVNVSSGTCDVYDSQGYVGQQTWTLSKPALGPDGVAGINWYPLIY